MTQTEAGTVGTESEPRRYVHFAQVRYADLDPQNHVNNVRMLTYIEDARILLLHGSGAEEGGENFGAIVVARQEADYVAPLMMRAEPVRVELWVTDVSNASFTLAYEVRDETTVFLRASTALVGFDTDRQGPRRLSTAEREFLARYF